MILTVTEINHWEHERWTYVLDTDKVGAEVINMLFLFCEMTNKETNRIKEEVMANSDHSWVRDMMGRNLYKLFAASNYRMRLYDGYELDASQSKYRVVLVEGKRKMNFGFSEGYKSGGMCLQERISTARLHGAIKAMQERKENLLYKDFESLFLKRKVRAK